MSKPTVLQNPYERYGVSKKGHSSAPSYVDVKKAIWVRRLLWILPALPTVAVWVWLATFAGPIFLLVSLSVFAATGLVLGVVALIRWLVDANKDALRILHRADSYGVKE